MALKRELGRVEKERDLLKEAVAFCQGVAVKYRMIDRCRDAFPARMMCRQFQPAATMIASQVNVH